MPLFLIAALAGVALWELQRHKHGAFTGPPGAVGPPPPVNAPPAAIAMYQSALASGNPIVIAQVAQALYVQGQPELARALAMRYQALTNNPLPFVPTTAAAGAQLHMPTVYALAAAARARRAQRVALARQHIAARLNRMS